MTPLEFMGYLSILFALISTTLMIVLELISPYYGKVSALMDRKKINQVAYASAGVFIATIAVRMLYIVMFP